MNNGRRRHIFVVSDATGGTCEIVVRAALSQFTGTEVVLEKVAQVRTAEQINATIGQAAKVHGVVVYTMVSAELRQKMIIAGLNTGVPTVDILGPILTRLSDHLEISPLAQPGLFRQLDDEYFNRIEAVDFTVKHDDGMGLETLGQAEIVLVGVSRTSKTPTSLYLSFRGWKVANIPVVPGLDLPLELFKVDQRRIIGLTVNPPFLQAIREERARNLGAGRGSYTDEEEIRKEVVYARRLFFENHWPSLNVTAKAIEETSSEVMQIIQSRAGQRKGSVPEQ